MVLWIFMAVLAAATCLPLLAPLYRAGRVRPSANAPAMAIYRDQIGEVDRDVARGVIAPPEAEAARTEIARRLIRESETPEATTTRPAERSHKLVTAAIIAMPVAALGLYLILGSPQRPDEPLAARPEVAQQQEIATLIRGVETHLAAAPDDGKGWEVIAPVYVKLGRFSDAVRAYSNVVRILGSTADREGDLGEAIVRANNGAVPPDAKAAFERAHALAADDPRPRFYLALALGDAGRKDEAIAAWHALLKDAPADAPWLEAGKAQLASLESPGPDAAAVDAAAKLPADQRVAMIQGMVKQLATRLKADPSDAEGWARLMRSYMVLNRAADARTALADARVAFAGDAAKTATIEAAARDLGLTENTQ
jgi:cytochrome c-type biogenesis protein CcmH